MAAKNRITFREILKQRRAADAWTKLKDVPKDHLERVKRYLEALANQEPSFPWRPPSPRDARRFVDRLDRDAAKIVRMNLYFGSELPLGDAECRNLPEIVKRYADALKKACRSRPRQPAENVNQEREQEIVRLLDQSVPGKERHYYEQAAVLIQGAYDVGSVNRTVDAGQLRRAYDRQSFRYHLSRRKNH